jgi:hypothetical protein
MKGERHRLNSVLSLYSLEIRVKSTFSHPVLGGADELPVAAMFVNGSK